MEAALGLSTDEAGRLRQICQDGFGRFAALVAEHSEIKPRTDSNNATVDLKTAAFAEDGAAFREQFKQQLAELLGPARTDAFWRQAAPVFTDLLNDFGSYPRAGNEPKLTAPPQ
ncbi:MAG: hypothetical protein JWR69_4703 [Pedosphaera sp.]|nr:hypothetical protein [Pedosphaera sp.]